MERLEDLVVRAQVGDHGAYSLIVERFQVMAFSYAYSILGDHELAEDAKQEAFLGAYCDLMTLKNPAAFPGWFRKIVLKHAVRLVRGRRTLMIPLEEAPEPVSRQAGPDRVAEERQTREQVLGAIGQLPAHEREVTRLFYLEEFSLRQISQRVGLPEKTIKSRLFMARARLRQRLMEMVKKTVQKQNLAGDKRVAEAASGAAIEQFDQELKLLLKTPTVEEQQRAGDLLCAKGRLLRFMGRTREALESFQSGLAIPALRRNPLFRARLRTEVGLTAVQTAHYSQAQKEFQGALLLLRREGAQPPDELLAAISNGLGLCAWGEGSFRKARRHYLETARLSSQAGCEPLEAEALNNLALLDWKDGRLEEALTGFQGCLRRWKKLGNRFGRALTLMNIGIAEENLGRYGLARRHYEEARALAEEVNFVQVQAATYGNLGNLALNQEEWAQALEDSRRGLELARGIGDRRSQAIALENMALAQGALRQFAEAHGAMQEARRIASAISDQERLLSLDLTEIETQLAGGEAEGAGPRLEAAALQVEKKGYQSEWPRLWRLTARAAMQSGEERRVGQALRRALRECRKQKNLPEEKKVLALEAQWAASHEKND